MICLGIETSCDETALALTRQGRLLAAVLASQIDLHAIFGGVVPELASREHQRFIGPLFDELLRRAQICPQDIDLIAVTRGPGLLGSLLIGTAFAKGLALSLGKPIIGVNHLHAHLLAAGLDPNRDQRLEFPALGLVVSGGHTEIYRMDSPWQFSRLGRTLDDAAGETFDKVGHALGLPYPAGRALNELAQKALSPIASLPRPYIDNDNLDFSFSGLKTAAINLAHEFGISATVKEQNKLASFSLAFNEAIACTLREKTKRALNRHPDISTLYLAGGVAANSIIRAELTDLMRNRKGSMFAPDLSLCGDNAAMIAYAGWLLHKHGMRHNLDFEAIPRGRPIPDDFISCSSADNLR